jgi:hypothetical protein
VTSPDKPCSFSTPHEVTLYIERGIFTELKDYNYFRRARIEYGTIVWPQEQDFRSETIEMKMRTA